MIRDLLERVSQPRGVKVDRLENGAIVLRRVKYLGARSQNVNPDGTNNVYPLEARRKSEHLYSGTKLFRDHPERTNPGRERSVEEQVGRLRGPFDHRPDGSYADVYLNPKHPMAEAIAWSAENSPDDCALSHNAQGSSRVEGRDCIIDQITHVRSVDVVCAGATTASLYESLDPRAKQARTMTDLLERLSDRPSRASHIDDIFRAFGAAPSVRADDPRPRVSDAEMQSLLNRLK